MGKANEIAPKKFALKIDNNTKESHFERDYCKLSIQEDKSQEDLQQEEREKMQVLSIFPKSNPSDEHSKQEEPEPISTEERQPFVNSLLNLIDQNKIDGIIDTQRHMMARFEKTNEMLVNCNALSLSRYEIAMKEVKRMSQNLGEMKKDLDYIFKRAKFIRTKYNQQHPEAFKSLMNKGNQLDEEEDEES